jgi:hypothetical protein
MFGLTDRETGEPVTQMTKTEYVTLWVVGLLIGLASARFVLVQPILDALKH